MGTRIYMLHFSFRPFGRTLFKNWKLNIAVIKRKLFRALEPWLWVRHFFQTFGWHAFDVALKNYVAIYGFEMFWACICLRQARHPCIGASQNIRSGTRSGTTLVPYPRSIPV